VIGTGTLQGKIIH